MVQRDKMSGSSGCSCIYLSDRQRGTEQKDSPMIHIQGIISILIDGRYLMVKLIVTLPESGLERASVLGKQASQSLC